jgi:hypothetical protein
MSSELNLTLQGGIGVDDGSLNLLFPPITNLSSTFDLRKLLDKELKKNENKVTLPKPIVLLDKYKEGFNFLPSTSPTEKAQNILDEFIDKTNISKPGYTPPFKDKKISSSQAPVRYTPKSEIELTNSEPASEPEYISKKSVEDPFDKFFGFTSPNYIPRNRNTKAKDLKSTLEPGYTSRSKKTETRSKRTEDPSYISKEYLKRASRY